MSAATHKEDTSMTAPEEDQTPAPLHVHALTALARKPLTAGRAARLIAFATVSVTIVGGILMHWADERNFPTIGRGLWWAVQTVTTVGYGDVVPTTTSGQLVAALVMIVGIAFIAVTTAAITSMFIEAARRRFRGSETDALAERLEEINASLAKIEARLADMGGARRDTR
jgi:hypothetical protein